MCTVEVLAVGGGKIFNKDSKVQSTCMHCTCICIICMRVYVHLCTTLIFCVCDHLHFFMCV